MPIVHRDKSDKYNFTKVPNEIINNKELSTDAIVVAIWLASKLKSWNIVRSVSLASLSSSLSETYPKASIRGHPTSFLPTLAYYSLAGCQSLFIQLDSPSNLGGSLS